MGTWKHVKTLWTATGHLWLAKDLALWILGPTAISAIAFPILVWAFTPASPFDLLLVADLSGVVAFVLAVKFAPRTTVVHHHSATIQLSGLQATTAIGSVQPSTSPLLRADSGSVIDADNAEIPAAVSDLFPGGFANASGSSLISMRGIKIIDARDKQSE